MTWQMWASALEGIRHFLTVYGDLEFSFEVEIDDPEGGEEGFVVGVGQLDSL